MNRFIIAEPQNCIGCRTCEVACALAHPVGQGDEALSVVNFHPRRHRHQQYRLLCPRLPRPIGSWPAGHTGQRRDE